MAMILSSKARVWVSYLVLLFFIFLLFPYSFYGPAMPGLDSSWMIALHMAFKYNLTFGKDFVFTYGPLGILKYRLPICISKFAYLAFDLYFIGILFWGLKIFIRRYFSPGPLIFMLVCILISGGIGIEQWFFFLQLFLLFSFLQEPGKISYLVHAALLSLFCLYIKVNSAIGATFIFLITLHYAFAVKKLNFRSYLIALLSYIILLLLSASLLHTWLPGYIMGYFQYIKDYGNCMYIPLSGKFGEIAGWGAAVIWSLYIITCLLPLTNLIRKRQLLPYLDTIFIYIIAGLSSFAWYRSAYIRADGHVNYLFEMMDLFVLLLYIFTPRDLGKKTVSIGCWAVLCCAFVVVNILSIVSQIQTPLYLRIAKFTLITDKVREIRDYFAGYATYDKAMAESGRLTALPNKFKDIIGDHSADIVPLEISTLYFNGLRYNPRPTLQSYTAHNKYLDELNYNKYMSAAAPDYILYSYNAIDQHFAWADEPRVQMALLSRYTLLEEVDDQLVLKKGTPRKLVKVKEDTIQVKLGEDIPVTKSNQLQFSQFFVDPDLGEKFKSFFYQPSPLTMTLRFENGHSRTYRAFRPMLADGMILNKCVDDTYEFELFMLSDGRINDNVKSIRIEPATPGGYLKDIKMINTWYQIDDKPQAQRTADSLRIVHLLKGNTNIEPLLQLPSDSDKQAIQVGIDDFKDLTYFVRVSGWAFLKKSNNENNKITVVLKSNDKLYELPTRTSNREDIPSLYQRRDAKNCGFTSVIKKSQLPPGNYQVGIAVYNDQYRNGKVTYLDCYAQIKSEYHLEKINPTTLADSKNIFYNIENLNETEDNILIEGWAVMPDADSKTITNLVLQNKEATYRINTDLTGRPDILAKFKKPFFEFSGFTVLIPKAGLPKGVYTIGLEKAYPGGKAHWLTLTDKSLKIGFPDFIIPERVDSLPPVKDFYGNIDALKDDPDFVTLEGWAIDEMAMVKQNSIDIVLSAGNGIYTAATEHTPRADITATFKNGLDLDNAGFAVKISKKMLPKGKYRVGILVLRPDHKGVVKLTERFITKE